MEEVRGSSPLSSKQGIQKRRKTIRSARHNGINDHIPNRSDVTPQHPARKGIRD